MSPALHNLWLLLVLKNLTPHKISSEYEKLWAAVTGGRGTGRGTKKKIVKGVDPKLLKYGRCGSINNNINRSRRKNPTPPTLFDDCPVF